MDGFLGIFNSFNISTPVSITFWFKPKLISACTSGVVSANSFLASSANSLEYAVLGGSCPVTTSAQSYIASVTSCSSAISFVFVL